MATLENSTAKEEGIHSPLHQQAYATIRNWILTGRLQPGRAVTLRELSEMLGVSAMPVRDAVRRLTAERALHMSDNRRVSIPEMTPLRLRQILFARLTLEPELAEQALKHITRAQAETIREIDDRMDVSIASGQSEEYMKLNYEFHFSIYERSQLHVLLDLTESVWLQFGPFMRVVFDRYKANTLIDHHKTAITSILECNAAKMREAISEDIRQGMQYICELWPSMNFSPLRSSAPAML
jgi:DNA-binding GntR family transcriptional regulator